jgi:hypothetical protein
MPAKRKSDVANISDDEYNLQTDGSGTTNGAKKPRVSDKENASSSKSKKAVAEKPKNWKDVTLEGEDEDEIPV